VRRVENLLHQRRDARRSTGARSCRCPG
jgi:hypothetical protein